MESYCGNIEDYKNYLQGKNKWNCQYVDPDIKRKQKSVFYNNLVKFYKYQEEKMRNSLKGKEMEFKFVGNNSPDYNFNDSPDSIHLTYKDNGAEKKLFLRSDQFGFSAPKGNREIDNSWTNRYPYVKYLTYNNEDEASCDFVADCIWTTRTIGGSLIWPIEMVKGPKRNKWSTKYNLSRGISSYLEDRIDLTLLEVKHYYEDVELYKKKNSYKDILRSSIISETSKINDFLSIFGSFKNYVKFFHLGDFVEKIDENTFMPLDIIFSNFEENIKIPLKNEQMYKKKLLKNLMNEN